MTDQQEIQRRLDNIIQQARAGNTDAQYALGVILARQKETVGQGVDWLNRAVQGGNATAMFTLGAWYIQGMLVPADYEKGHQLLQQASQKNFNDADIMRAALYATGIGVEKDWKRALALVIESAKSGYGRALSQLAFLCDMAGGKGLKEQGEILLGLAADAYEPIALYTRAKRTLEGSPSEKDRERARLDLAIAAKVGRHPLATEAPGIQGVAVPEAPPPRNLDLTKVDWAKVERALAKPPVPQTLKRDVVNPDPLIAAYPDFLSHEECDYLVALANPLLRPSQVTNPLTGESIHLDYRTSSDMRFWHVYQDLVIHCINQRIAKATGERLEQQEMLGVLRYQPGQEYKPHGDFLTVTEGVPNEEVERSGQRIKTFLCYLNEGYEGGETEFIKLGKKVKGGKGDGLLFHNVDSKGGPDERTIHAGQPVTKGVKWLSTIWIREHPYRFRG